MRERVREKEREGGKERKGVWNRLLNGFRLCVVKFIYRGEIAQCL
jgi:hypothetical protein